MIPKLTLFFMAQLMFEMCGHPVNLQVIVSYSNNSCPDKGTMSSVAMNVLHTWHTFAVEPCGNTGLTIIMKAASDNWISWYPFANVTLKKLCQSFVVYSFSVNTCYFTAHFFAAGSSFRLSN